MRRYIGIGVNVKEAKPYPFNRGDRLIERNFKSDIEAIGFVKQRWEGKGDLTHMLLLRIDKRHPHVVENIDLRKE